MGGIVTEKGEVTKFDPSRTVFTRVADLMHGRERAYTAGNFTAGGGDMATGTPNERAKGKIGCVVLVALLFACWWLFGGSGDDADSPADPTRAPGQVATDAPAEPTDVPEPTAPPVTDADVQAAADKLMTSLDEVDAGAGIDLFLFASIRMVSVTPVCTVTMSDLWYGAQKFEKERLLDAVAGACVQATSSIRDDDTYPETHLIDTAEKRLATRSNLGFDSYEDD